MTDKSLRDMRLSGAPASAHATELEYPCDYSLKIVGDAVDHLSETVVKVVEDHDTVFDRNTVRLVDSRNGKFQSVRLTITATGPEQIAALHADLKATGLVHMVI
ncbi:HP0495 family protein [Onishia niordana]|uniref:HP0495 family protein n=1 Tax=Onishia niordana TaxID=2508711 RepID=UPI00109F4478|nr:DUF493 domain-containing protein [Halomonas niordiana]